MILWCGVAWLSDPCIYFEAVIASKVPPPILTFPLAGGKGRLTRTPLEGEKGRLTLTSSPLEGED